jgi:hypothetical protein
LERPEIKEAFLKGTGLSIRFSSTLSKDTYYYAVLLGTIKMRLGSQPIL